MNHQFGEEGRTMGNQREIRQISPREGLGVVIPVRPGHEAEVVRLLGEEDKGHWYMYFFPAGEPIQLYNMDFAEDIALGPQPQGHLGIQSGGKMWCGYEEFVERVRVMAPHLEDAVFYVGDEVEYIDEFRLSGGVLDYRRVLQGWWWPVDCYIETVGKAPATEPLYGVQSQEENDTPQASS